MPLSHVDEAGRLAMVDVSAKPPTDRTATASGIVHMQPATIAAIRARTTPKGDPLETARLAGILAAKQTDRLIPLCHTLPLAHVNVELALETDHIAITATARAHASTGVEMEALTAVSVAALTLFDMCKAVDRTMRITDIQVQSKTGGKSDWNAPPNEA
ncbi:MAG: cyclic pyranopterin monophosphate synthase MoaC [Chloracidobacterium sp.]|uniref:Cyclic pyranopterin monophosphate synthase n=1 Tax=Chloracidobacterium validum TaxID=2821543 RepID=A0ABX8B9Q8_9BACT|nr:cyclic pyranopterin monophosphate synthase MoaC [Chloracidobacterium validum]QUW03406.1 cyclic pyranopterin monophosphate synthase MoaC [Chloracidobacterium validum]